MSLEFIGFVGNQNQPQTRSASLPATAGRATFAPLGEDTTA
jgi:hypothetical protein